MSAVEDETIDLATLKQWIGRQEIIEDVVTVAPVKALSATLDRSDSAPKAGDALPQPWQWLYFLPSPKDSDLGVDGHPKKGGFLPPVPLPRRMWAGGSIEVFDALRVGESIKRVSTIKDVTHKTGASGELVFVTVQHEIFSADRLAISERQDLVYREDPKPGAPVATPKPAPETFQWSRSITATPPLLFRYSALTFNSHRIHYDKDYAVDVEGYKDLVVQGPLTATLLLDLLRREQPLAKLKRFDYRGIRPLLANADFTVQGVLVDDEPGDALAGQKLQKAKLWTRDCDGAVTMQAEVFFTAE